MDQTDATTCTDEAQRKYLEPKLYNDVHFPRWASAPPRGTTWAPFPRLPAELRLQVWLLCLRRNRMIEVDFSPAADEDDLSYPGDVSQSRYYTERNHLGNIVSGRGYTLTIRGGGYATLLNPLLWVNQDARHAALRFYRVHLPFLGRHGEMVLYLNPEFDVVYVRPQKPIPRDGRIVVTADGSWGQEATILADLLHDIKAYDYKDQGITHLTLHRNFFFNFLVGECSVRLTPAMLHPTAATSFADILGRSLRSLFCIVGFRHPTRAMGEFPSNNWYYHFAHTFPLWRRGSPTCDFHWFETDPRPGVEFDTRQVPLDRDPRSLQSSWERIEHAFGITKEQRAAQREEDKNSNGGFRFYICPTMKWPSQRCVLENQARLQEEGSREELAQFLEFEADAWYRERKFLSDIGNPGNTRVMAKHGWMIDAETFEMMEKFPCTAIGMWLFPAEAFKEPTIAQRSCFDVSAVRPGLLLFEV